MLADIGGWLLIPPLLLDLTSAYMHVAYLLHRTREHGQAGLSWFYYAPYSMVGLDVVWWGRLAVLAGLTLFHAACQYYTPRYVAVKLGWQPRESGSACRPAGMMRRRGPDGEEPCAGEMKLRVVEGDLLNQDVDVIVNPWNRNLVPWWLLLPQGVSGAIKRRGGTGPFRELRGAGILPPGGAVITSAGRLPFKAIIHVAGISHLSRASEASVRAAVRNAVALAAGKGFRSIAFPLIGAGSGGMAPERVLAIMKDEIGSLDCALDVRIVRLARRR